MADFAWFALLGKNCVSFGQVNSQSAFSCAQDHNKTRIWNSITVRTLRATTKTFSSHSRTGVYDNLLNLRAIQATLHI